MSTRGYLVVTSEEGLEKNSAARAYAQSFNATFNSQDLNQATQILTIADKLKQKLKHTIICQQKIYDAIGGLDTISQLAKMQNATEDSYQLVSREARNISKKFFVKKKQFADKLNATLEEEKKFQDLLFVIMNRLEEIQGQPIEVNTFKSIIIQVKQKWAQGQKSWEKIEDSVIQEIALQAKQQREIGTNLEKKYQSLRTILQKMKTNQMRQLIKDSDGRVRVVIKGKKIQKLENPINDLINELQTYFQVTEKSLNSLMHWTSSTKGGLAKSFTNLIKQLQEASSKAGDPRSRQDIINNLIQVIQENPNQNSGIYNTTLDGTGSNYTGVSASLRGNAAEIIRSAQVDFGGSIINFPTSQKKIQDLAFYHLGNLSNRTITKMVRTKVEGKVREKTQILYRGFDTSVNDFINIKPDQILTETQMLIKTAQQQETDDKVDRLVGFKYPDAQGNETQYYIAFSDKFKEYNSLIDLAVVGSEGSKKEGQKLSGLAPLNSNKDIFQNGDRGSHELLFSILNESTASYLRKGITEELEKMISLDFFNLAFNPNNFEKINSKLYEGLDSEHILYVHALGGNLYVPVFQTLEAMYSNMLKAEDAYGLIQKVVTTALEYGSIPSGETLVNLAYAETSNNSAAWTWVANHVASSIKIKTQMHIEQLLKLFGIVPM